MDENIPATYLPNPFDDENHTSDSSHQYDLIGQPPKQQPN